MGFGKGPDIGQLKHQRTVKKKTRSEDRKIAKAMKAVKKKVCRLDRRPFRMRVPDRYLSDEKQG